MNKLFAFALTLMIGSAALAQDPVVMSINGKDITKSEFLQIYLKNNDNPKYDRASLDEYLDLFKKFKLKVAEAEALGYDTIPKLMKELEGYRKQLARPYLIDSTKNEALIQEAYNRTVEEVRASHILIRLDGEATPEDTLRAYNRIMDLKKRIESGKTFEQVAKSNMGSEDPSVKSNGGDLGYFNAFQMVYPFEDKAFKTSVGKVSDPFRTRFGYHILQVTDKRPSRGTIQTAHLMIAVDRNSGEAADDDAKKKIDEIYGLLKNGGNWDELVAKHSDDPSSNRKGGMLPVFGTGASTRMVPEFTEAAFAIKNDGDISEPLRTDYGYHIIKRISHKPVPSFDELKREISSKVSKDQRSAKTQDSFVQKLKKEYKFKSKSSKGLKWFKENIDSTFHMGQFKADQLPKNKWLFKLEKQKFNQKDFAEYLEKNYRNIKKENVEILVNGQYEKWEKQAILEYEEGKLAGKYPAFKALVTEYHDGILLYEVMSDMVWNKAMKDTTGLKEYHANHHADYVWGKRLDADVFECNSMENAEKVKELLNVDTLTATTVTRMVNETSALNVKHRRSKFDVERTPYIKDAGVTFKDGINKIYEYQGKYYLVRVKEILAPGEKEFDEAKGAITSDYQNYLEKEWLKELNQKHKIVVNEDVLYGIGN